MKKIFSLILSVIMVLSLSAVSFGASNVSVGNTNIIIEEGFDVITTYVGTISKIDKSIITRPDWTQYEEITYDVDVPIGGDETFLRTIYGAETSVGDATVYTVGMKVTVIHTSNGMWSVYYITPYVDNGEDITLGSSGDTVVKPTKPTYSSSKGSSSSSSGSSTPDVSPNLRNLPSSTASSKYVHSVTPLANGKYAWFPVKGVNKDTVLNFEVKVIGIDKVNKTITVVFNNEISKTISVEDVSGLKTNSKINVAVTYETSPRDSSKLVERIGVIKYKVK